MKNKYHAQFTHSHSRYKLTTTMVGAEWTSEFPYNATPVTKIGQNRYVMRP